MEKVAVPIFVNNNMRKLIIYTEYAYSVLFSSVSFETSNFPDEFLIEYLYILCLHSVFFLFLLAISYDIPTYSVKKFSYKTVCCLCVVFHFKRSSGFEPCVYLLTYQ